MCVENAIVEDLSFEHVWKNIPVIYQCFSNFLICVVLNLERFSSFFVSMRSRFHPGLGHFFKYLIIFGQSVLWLQTN